MLSAHACISGQGISSPVKPFELSLLAGESLYLMALGCRNLPGNCSTGSISMFLATQRGKQSKRSLSMVSSMRGHKIALEADVAVVSFTRLSAGEQFHQKFSLRRGLSPQVDAGTTGYFHHLVERPLWQSTGPGLYRDPNLEHNGFFRRSSSILRFYGQCTTAERCTGFDIANVGDAGYRYASNAGG